MTEKMGLWIAEAAIFPAIGRYVTHIETGETKDTCKCEWLEDHSTGLKLQRVEESLECPVHTKEGFLLGFFRFMFPDSDITRPADEEAPPSVAEMNSASDADAQAVFEEAMRDESITVKLPALSTPPRAFSPEAQEGDLSERLRQRIADADAGD